MQNDQVAAWWKCPNTRFDNNSKDSANKGNAFDTSQDIERTQVSVADELLKWAKLKEDGHISEEEFQEARDKLLKKH